MAHISTYDYELLTTYYNNLLRASLSWGIINYNLFLWHEFSNLLLINFTIILASSLSPLVLSSKFFNYAFPDLLNTTSTTFIVDAIVEMQERDAISSYRNINFWSFQLRSLFITLSPISHLMSLLLSLYWMW